MPNAATDGDSAVWFRRSDVIATGDVYNSDIYPRLTWTEAAVLTEKSKRSTSWPICVSPNSCPRAER